MTYAHELKELANVEVVKVDGRMWGEDRVGFVLENGQVVVVALSTTQIYHAEQAKQMIAERVAKLATYVAELDDAQDSLDKVKAITPKEARL